MTRLRMIVLLLFVVAFGAGLSVGRLWSHRHVPSPPPRGSSWLSTELGLSEAQRKQMYTIWDRVNHSGFDEGRQRRELQKQRQDAIAALVPAEQQSKLQEINESYSRQVSEMYTRRRQRFAQAVEETKAILSPQQREKYEEVLARREQARRDRGRTERPRRTDRGSGMRRSPRSAAPEAPDATRPATQPQRETALEHDE